MFPFANNDMVLSYFTFYRNLGYYEGDECTIYIGKWVALFKFASYENSWNEYELLVITIFFLKFNKIKILFTNTLRYLVPGYFSIQLVIYVNASL